MAEDKIEIKSEEGNIEIKGGEDIKIQGQENTVKVDAGHKNVEIKGDENRIKIKDSFISAGNFFKQKKVWNIIFIILLIAIIVLGVWIRVQNLPLLKDSTTGGYIPLALDPYYFLRVAETAVESGGFGNLPEFDSMRYPSLHLDFTKEFTPKAIVLLYQLTSIFDKDVSLRLIDVLSPVIFFALAMLVFFFLIFKLTKSKPIALISSFFLAIIPSYLYRTMAGFADHESIGMFAFFLAMLGYVLILDFFEKNKNIKKTIIPVLFGAILGFLSGFTNVAWGGISKFLYMIIPLSFFLFWILKSKNKEDIKEKYLFNLLIFYFIWIISSVLFTHIFGHTILTSMGKVFLKASNRINGFVFLFLLIDFLLIKFRRKISFLTKEKTEKYRILFSLGIVIILGGIFVLIQGGGFLSSIIQSLLDPFGGGRIGSTVAENKSPYLADWFGQMGKSFFWLFFAGMIFVGVEISEGIKKHKNKIGFILLWILMICGVLFSRISSSSMFNGDNFISKLFYLGTFILFIIYCGRIYFKDEIKINSGLLIIASWLILMLVSGRGAVRLFFLIMPFVVFMGGFCAVKVFEYAKKSKEDILKLLFWVAFVLIIIVLVINAVHFEKNTLSQARYQSPSANYQWQNAMSWVRNNTAVGSIFVHWWDYGYWVQTLGERPTVTDGGHGNSYWDHLIGRYVLTTPVPETALSFMKAHNVSYLLIDPTDIGKYSAYSSIGSDEQGTDRYSWIPVIGSNSQQIQETKDGLIRLYNGGFGIDEDIVYKNEGEEIFLPKQKTMMGGILLEETGNSVKQPQAIFIYNNQQINIPMRYAYYNDKLIDFGTGLEAAIYPIPVIEQTSQGVELGENEAAIYLSPKTMHGLVSELYILNDPFNHYQGVELAHAEHDSIKNYLDFQGADLNEFFYYSGTLRGPLKIWKITHREDIIAREEFLRVSGEYAEFDDLGFVE